jgi:hypothetical protein
MSAIWRCRVCEGVNQGGRVCATCGTEVPVGEPLRAAVRTRMPSTTAPAAPAPSPVPPTTRRRELRSMPSPDELRMLDPEELFTRPDLKILPIPGGCLVSVVPKELRPRR